MQKSGGRVVSGDTRLSAGQNYRDLIAWQKAMLFVESTYRFTTAFPADERFGLVSQLRRCAVSVPSNIAEGQGRGNDGDFVRFLQIAHGSLREAETQIELSNRLGFADPHAATELLDLASEVGRLLNGLMRSKRP